MCVCVCLRVCEPGASAKLCPYVEKEKQRALVEGGVGGGLERGCLWPVVFFAVSLFHWRELQAGKAAAPTGACVTLWGEGKRKGKKKEKERQKDTREQKQNPTCAPNEELHCYFFFLFVFFFFFFCFFSC